MGRLGMSVSHQSSCAVPGTGHFLCCVFSSLPIYGLVHSPGSVAEHLQVLTDS